MAKDYGILGDCIIDNNLEKFIKQNLKNDETKKLKEKKYIIALLKNAAAKYIDLKRFKEDFNLEEANYKNILEYFLLNYDQIYMYGNRLYENYRCYKNLDSFDDDALEEEYADVLEEEQNQKIKYMF